jgi:methyl-accepting chemotaxis protein
MEQVTTRHFYRTRLFLFTLIVVVLGAAFAAIGVFSLLPAGLGTEYGSVLSTIRGLENALMQKVAILYAVISVGIIIAMVYLHLFYSHRVAGPAYRLSKEAEKISNGNLKGNIKFRQKDNLTDMADSLNAVASRYRDRLDVIRNEIASIESQSEKLASLMAHSKSDPALETIADNIEAKIKSVDGVLAELRT